MKKLEIELLYKEAPERLKNKAFEFENPNHLKIYLGSEKNLDINSLRLKVSKAPWKDLETEEACIKAPELNPDQLLAVYELIRLKSNIFDKYKTNKNLKHQSIKKIDFKLAPKQTPIGANRLKLTDKILDAVFYCRDLVSSNASELNPAFIESEAKNISLKSDLIKLKVIDSKQAKKLGMDCLLAVGAESLKNSPKEFHPRILVLEFDPSSLVTETHKKKLENLAIAAKGISFDTGGLCLKPNEYMLDMKSDMAASAAVLSVFKFLSEIPKNQINPHLKITAALALAENAFGGASYKPGDVLRAMNGKTVEVVDTDAEGRLVLADALSYLSKLKPSKILDLATLTGSVVSSLGEAASGGMTNNEEFFKDFKEKMDEVGDKLWQLPIWEDYKKLLDSEIADIKHCSSRPDAILAAIFLKEFIPETTPWIHVDMAGTGFQEREGVFSYEGASGYPVRGLINFILHYKKKDQGKLASR
jgi:leucyl aminopeptidase